MVGSLVKQRRDSIEQFLKGGRKDLADKEAAEIVVLESYLPPPPIRPSIERAVADAIAETGATSPKDMGRVMKAVDGPARRPDRRRQEPSTSWSEEACRR